MARRTRIVVALAALVLLPGLAGAQFGHPLKGQWSGERTVKGETQRLLVDLDWDGKEITGVVNPGPNAAIVKSVAFDYGNVSAWGVKMTIEGKDASGKPLAITVDGTLENIGAYRRLFHGTWTEGGQKGEFTLTRN
jgi:hypothetical protein